MLIILLKGGVLLLSIVGGVFLISAQSIATLVNGPDIQPIVLDGSTDANRQDRDQLKGFLFGAEQTAGRRHITETSLSFVLKGTIPSNNEKNSFAILSLKGEPERVVRVGDELTENVVLLEVQKDYVFIQHEGGRERINFPVVDRTGLITNKPASPQKRGKGPNPITTKVVRQEPAQKASFASEDA